MKITEDKMLLTSIFVVLLFAPIIGFFSVVETRANSSEKKSDYIDAFQRAFGPTNWRQENFFLHHQTWPDIKQFCVVRGNPTTFSDYAVTTIEEISLAYDRKSQIVEVDTVSDCPKFEYGVVILLSENPGFKGFQSIFMTLSGDAPEDDFMEFGKQIAFTIPLHRQPKQTFLYLDSTFSTEHSPHDVRRSIFLEELMHALSGGRDIFTSDMLSILGENHDVESYEHWYTKNPKGLCDLDFVILELVISRPQSIPRYNFEASIEYLNANFHDLRSSAEDRRQELRHIADPRCI